MTQIEKNHLSIYIYFFPRVFNETNIDLIRKQNRNSLEFNYNNTLLYTEHRYNHVYVKSIIVVLTHVQSTLLNNISKVII